MSQEDFFSETYFEARRKFLETTVNARHIPKDIKDGLTMDTAVYDSKKEKKTLFVINSGTHGIEGFVGSAVQQMVVDYFIDGGEIPENMGVALVHAVNPYGFAFYRRVNEHNVDLNRAFVGDYEPLRSDEKRRKDFRRVYNLLTPHRRRKSHGIESARFCGKLALAFAREILIHDDLEKACASLKNAIAGGQYTHPDSLFYGGGLSDKPERSVEAYREVLDDIARDYSTVVVLDTHVGFGTKGNSYITENRDQDTLELLAEIDPRFEPTNKHSGKLSDVYDVTGSLLSDAMTHLKGKQVYTMAIEFKTMNIFRVLARMIAENQASHKNKPFDGICQNVRHRFIESFYPSDQEWRENMLDSAERLIGKTIGAFELSGIL